MLPLLDWSALSEAERKAALARPDVRAGADVRGAVEAIFAEVEREGSAAVERWALKLDKKAPERVVLDDTVVAAARKGLSDADLAALATAASNVHAYHEASKPKDQRIEVRPGVVCERRWRPIETCGLYIPGGSAPLFSTLLMLALPAQAAGVRNIVLATPPNRAGAAEPVVIAAAAACGLSELWLLGGAQAIAAMAFGAGLPKVDKIFGPGNAYVAEAKRLAASLPNGPQIDTPAGPSELMVIADAGARADFVAADLLSQAEHDADAQVILATDSLAFAEAVRREVERQLQSLPRAEIAARALTNARLILVRDLDEAAGVANAYAPEHLSLQTGDAEALSQRIDNAGAVFVGSWSAETFGDYVCGPSHVLPTDGAARSWSGVSVASFMKCVNVQTLSSAGARALSDSAARLARLEGLEAHARAADIRGG